MIHLQMTIVIGAFERVDDVLKRITDAQVQIVDTVLLDDGANIVFVLDAASLAWLATLIPLTQQKETPRDRSTDSA